MLKLSHRYCIHVRITQRRTQFKHKPQVLIVCNVKRVHSSNLNPYKFVLLGAAAHCSSLCHAERLSVLVNRTAEFTRRILGTSNHCKAFAAGAQQKHVHAPSRIKTRYQFAGLPAFSGNHNISRFIMHLIQGIAWIHCTQIVSSFSVV
jgi:hypothetical protein